MEAPTAWEAGRLDGIAGPEQLLFGRVYEDGEIEAAAFPPGGRVFCIASAGCTALRLAAGREVTAVDINPVQLEYARSRAAGAPMRAGRAERRLSWGRRLLPLAGWRGDLVRDFLDLEDPAAQVDFWRRWLDTARFRLALDALFGAGGLRAFYAPPLLASLPPRFGAVLRGRLERCWARHPNRRNPYARALLLGELPREAPRPAAGLIRFVLADAAEHLESCPPASFDAFSLSNILDGAKPGYERRLFAAVARAAAPGAVVVLRSFREPEGGAGDDRAADDRSPLWGRVTARPAAR